jgi:signal transduction histidine kinase
MNLKKRFSLLFSLLFSVLLASVMLVVYYLFAKFRSEEFRDRLEEKAKTTVKLLIEVKEIDYKLQKIIDKNTINKLYDEKVLVFDDSLNLIYSSIDDAPIMWTADDLKALKEKKKIERKNNQYEVYGVYFSLDNKYYSILISATDKYGYRKLTYLKFLLISAFVASVGLVWFLSYYLSKEALMPLDNLRKQIQDITDKSLNTRLPERNNSDEIGVLAASFNQMMERIDNAYNKQKEFKANASHELRTPIARIVTQLENLILDKNTPPIINKSLKQISEDCYQLSDIISSLLILSRIETENAVSGFKPIRLDELIFDSANLQTKYYPDFRFQFEIESEHPDFNLEILGDETLLSIALGNLFKNAYKYSDNGLVKCLIKTSPECIELQICNTGTPPDLANPNELFNSFTRGSNALQKPGSGLGLSIVQRILQYHNATIEFIVTPPMVNTVNVRFKT